MTIPAAFGLEKDYLGNPSSTNPTPSLPKIPNSLVTKDFSSIWKPNLNGLVNKIGGSQGLNFIANLRGAFPGQDDFHQAIATFDPSNPTQTTPAGSSLSGFLSSNPGAIQWLMNYVNGNSNSESNRNMSGGIPGVISLMNANPDLTRRAARMQYRQGQR